MMILPWKQEGSDHSWEGGPVFANKKNPQKNPELCEAENVVLFQSFRELVALDVDLNKNPETSDFYISLCLEEKKKKKKKCSIQKAWFDLEFSERSCGAVGLF